MKGTPKYGAEFNNRRYVQYETTDANEHVIMIEASLFNTVVKGQGLNKFLRAALETILNELTGRDIQVQEFADSFNKQVKLASPTGIST
jgi:hypothetical protein